MEWGPLHRPPPRTGCAVLQPADRGRRSGAHRHRADRTAAFWHRAAAVDGRAAVPGGGVVTPGRPLALVALIALTAGVLGCGPRHVKTGRRVIVLGIDGMDYSLVRDLMARGRLPHFARLAQSGGFAPLRTTVPPQSPVA